MYIDFHYNFVYETAGSVSLIKYFIPTTAEYFEVLLALQYTYIPTWAWLVYKPASTALLASEDR